MSQQDDERIARKLLDLGSRSDRVQIRNGITYLDGYALGNGTVEIRSQVVRDRRRREPVVIEGYAAAILYEVVNGTNSEIWLQDDGAAPVLIATLPQRIELGWTQPSAAGGTLLGHFIRQRLDGDVVLSPQIVINGAGVPQFFYNLKAIYDTPASIALRWGDSTFWKSIAGTYFLLQTGGGSTELRVGNILEPGTVTLESIANVMMASVQRRQGGTYIYLRYSPYHSESIPVPNLTTGNVWMAAQYWVNGILDTGEPTPDPGDITGSVLNNALRQRLAVDDAESPLNGRLLGRGTNIFSIRESLSVASIDAFLATEENQGTAEVAISVFKTGSTAVFSTQRFSCAPANARQVLSVAIYPRG
jgi:hypothetical protein